MIMELINQVEDDVIEPRSSHALLMRFQRVLSDAGLEKMRFHDLRHINASVMAELGISEPVAQARGGWSTDATMKTVYTHAFSKARKEADAKIDSYFESIFISSEE